MTVARHYFSRVDTSGDPWANFLSSRRARCVVAERDNGQWEAMVLTDDFYRPLLGSSSDEVLTKARQIVREYLGGEIEESDEPESVSLDKEPSEEAYYIRGRGTAIRLSVDEVRGLEGKTGAEIRSTVFRIAAEPTRMHAFHGLDWSYLPYQLRDIVSELFSDAGGAHTIISTTRP